MPAATVVAAKLPADPATATALKLWVVLARAYNAIRTHALADITRHELTEGEFAILDALYHKGRLLQGEIQKKILVSSGGITFLVDKLEERGLVRRIQSKDDRRARYAELTTKGEELMDTIFPPHAESIRHALAGLGLSDQRKLTELLKSLGVEAAALEPKNG